MNLDLPSDLLSRLRRAFAVSGVLALALVAAACPGDDDDDDDDGTGPSADCIDEIDFTDAPPGVDEDDVEPIDVGDSESGSLSTSDPEVDEGNFIDIYSLAVENGGEVTIELDPTGFDAVLLLFTPDVDDAIAGADAGFEGDPEEIVEDLDEGCYVIVVTSFEPGETGSYTLSVD